MILEDAERGVSSIPIVRRWGCDVWLGGAVDYWPARFECERCWCLAAPTKHGLEKDGEHDSVNASPLRLSTVPLYPGHVPKVLDIELHRGLGKAREHASLLCLSSEHRVNMEDVGSYIGKPLVLP